MSSADEQQSVEDKILNEKTVWICVAFILVGVEFLIAWGLLTLESDIDKYWFHVSQQLASVFANITSVAIGISLAYVFYRNNSDAKLKKFSTKIADEIKPLLKDEISTGMERHWRENHCIEPYCILHRRDKQQRKGLVKRINLLIEQKKAEPLSSFSTLIGELETNMTEHPKSIHVLPATPRAMSDYYLNESSGLKWIKFQQSLPEKRKKDTRRVLIYDDFDIFSDGKNLKDLVSEIVNTGTELRIISLKEISSDFGHMFCDMGVYLDNNTSPKIMYFSYLNKDMNVFTKQPCGEYKTADEILMKDMIKDFELLWNKSNDGKKWLEKNI